MKRHIFALAIALGCISNDRMWAQISESPIGELVSQLEDSDVEKRRDAAYELVRRVDYSDEVVLGLAKATSDSDIQVRFQALMGLARGGHRSTPAIEPLIKCLRDRDDQVRFRAADALGKIGSPAIEPLVDAWESASDDSRISIAQALGQAGTASNAALPLLKEALQTGSSDLARHAAQSLVSITPDDDGLLLEMMNNDEPEVRIVAIKAIAEHSISNASASSASNDADASSQALRAALTDDAPKVREAAVIALSKSSIPNEEKSKYIEQSLLDETSSVRAAAVVSMRRANLASSDFALQLTARLQNANPETALAIVQALSSFGPIGRPALPMLIEVAAAKQEGGQPLEPAAVATTLASFGAQGVPDLLAAIQSYPAIEPVLATALAQIGEPAFPSLLAGMKNDDELIRTAATRAIGSVRPLTPELIENLGAALQDASSTIRKLALEALINAGEPAESAEDKVLAACQDSDSEVRSIAIRGLSAFQYSPEQLSSAVSQSLADSAALVRANAVAVLRDLPEQLAAHVDDVVELAFDPVNDVRKSSMHALAGLKMDQIPDAVRIAVIDGLHDSDIAVRIAATEASNELNLDQVEVVDAIANNLQADTQLLQVSLNALAEVGGKAQSALPSIVNLLSHPSSTVRSSAIQAIVTIEQDQTLLAQQLQSSLEDSEWEVRKLAAVQLGKLGPTAVAAVPKLFTMLSSEDDSDFASSALREINSAPPEAVGLLMENLGSEDRRLGFYSVSLLGKIGPQAAEALPKLEEMLAKANEEGAGGRSEFRTRFLREAIAAIRNEKSE